MAAEGVLVDTGPLVAILSRRDQYHRLCADEAIKIRGPFYTAWPVVVEAAYLLKGRIDRVRQLLGRIRDQRIRLLNLDAADMDGIISILDRYADQKFDFADAALMYLAERDGLETVFTVDQRHFSIYRILSGRSLAIVPASPA